MIKEILREIRNYFEDKKHDKALTVLRKKYDKLVFYVKEDTERTNYYRFAYLNISFHKEGNIWHYIKQGVYSYLAKKMREQCKK